MSHLTEAQRKILVTLVSDEIDLISDYLADGTYDDLDEEHEKIDAQEQLQQLGIILIKLTEEDV